MRMGQSFSVIQQQLGLPSVYLSLLLEVMRRMGHNERLVLPEQPFDRSLLLSPQKRISMSLAHAATCNAAALAGDQGLGFAYAKAMKITIHGALGMMALSSPTIGSALDAASQYLVLRAPFLHYLRNPVVHKGVPCLEVRMEPSFDLHQLNPRVYRLVMEILMVGLANMGEQLLGRPLQGAVIQMPGAAPSYYEEFRHELPTPIDYGSPGYAILFPQKLLAERPLLADPDVAALARLQCEQEFQSLLTPMSNSTVAKVERILRDYDGVLPGLEQMARFLHVSPRTLKRHLQSESSSWRELHDRELLQRAERGLQDPRMSVSNLAFQLGYNDTSNFSRAFRRWTGMTPREYRQKHLQQES